MLKLILLIVPLGLDTFAVSAAVGLGGLKKRERLRISLLLSSFEMAMPVVGLLLGHGLGRAIGGAADYLAIATLALLGIWMLVEKDEAEVKRVERLSSGRGLAFVALGLSISVDELAMGFTIGLLHLSIWLAIVLVGAQAFRPTRPAPRRPRRPGDPRTSRAARRHRPDRSRRPLPYREAHQLEPFA